MRRNNLIEVLKTQDLKLSIGDFIKELEQKSVKELKEKEYEDSLVIGKYTNVYLELLDDDGIYGKEVEVIHCKEISFQSYDTDFRRCYGIQGNKIVFSKRSINSWEMTPTDANNMKTLEELKLYKIIEKTDYEDYLNKHNKIKDMLNLIIN
jgi:hypothetical protein